MRFLVTMEHIDTGDAPLPRELGAFLENVVLPSLKTLGEWEKAGKAKGGILAGRRGAAFILDVDSHEQLSDMLRSVPIWGLSDIDIVPLESIDHRYKTDGETAKRLRSM
jgi:muconolactone delta-isomerase